MNHTICNQVRLEIDEKDLSAPLSAASMEHLQRCGECQEFQNKEKKLRQIVGSLETVKAPADFDFRLRARLANDSSLSVYQLAAPLRLLRSRSFAVAAMLLIFAGTVVTLRQINQPKAPPITQTTENNKVVTPSAPQPAEVLAGRPTDQGGVQETAVAARPEKRNTQRRQLTTTSGNRRPTTSFDFGSSPAPVIRGEQSMATMSTFPLDVSQQSYKVSLDDGRGSSRTISVPTVSFGSRRVFTSASMSSNQFAPKGDW